VGEQPLHLGSGDHVLEAPHPYCGLRSAGKEPVAAVDTTTALTSTSSRCGRMPRSMASAGQAARHWWHSEQTPSRGSGAEPGGPRFRRVRAPARRSPWAPRRVAPPASNGSRRLCVPCRARTSALSTTGRGSSNPASSRPRSHRSTIWAARRGRGPRPGRSWWVRSPRHRRRRPRGSPFGQVVGSVWRPASQPVRGEEGRRVGAHPNRDDGHITVQAVAVEPRRRTA